MNIFLAMRGLVQHPEFYELMIDYAINKQQVKVYREHLLQNNPKGGPQVPTIPPAEKWHEMSDEQLRNFANSFLPNIQFNRGDFITSKHQGYTSLDGTCWNYQTSDATQQLHSLPRSQLIDTNGRATIQYIKRKTVIEPDEDTVGPITEIIYAPGFPPAHGRQKLSYPTDDIALCQPTQTAANSFTRECANSWHAA